MIRQMIPTVNNLTLFHLAEKIKSRYEVNLSGNFGMYHYLHLSEAVFRAKKNGRSPVTVRDAENMLAATKNKCAEENDDFYETIEEWFPLLSRKKFTPEQIDEIIIANLVRTPSETSAAGNPWVGMSTADFFRECLQYPFPIKRIRMAAHTGWSFFDNPDKRKILKDLLEKGIEIQFIGNIPTPETREILTAMRDPGRELDYRGLNNTFAEWKRYETRFSNLHVLVSTLYPLLHQVYFVEFDSENVSGRNEKESCHDLLFVRNYTYGTSDKKPVAQEPILSDSAEYDYYRTEYDFLWEHAVSYDEWIRSVPATEEN